MLPLIEYQKLSNESALEIISFMFEEQILTTPFNERAQTYLATHFPPTDKVMDYNNDSQRLTLDLEGGIERSDRTDPAVIKRQALDHTLKWACINGYVDNNDRRYLETRDIPGVMEHRRNIYYDHVRSNSYHNVVDIISGLEGSGVTFSVREKLYIYRYALSNSVDRLHQANNEITEEDERSRLTAHLAAREQELAEVDKLYAESSQTDPENPAISLFRDLPYPWEQEYKDNRELADTYDPGLTSEELDRFILERNEYLERKVIDDEKGNELCQVDVDKRTGQITTIYPAYFQNISEAAEQPEELVNATDERGDILPERITREGVRDEQRQYLLATQVLFNVKNWGDDTIKLLVQTRSPHKEIDPDRRSLSAHGVAKALFTQGGERLMHGQEVALIATALETNEELRHGAEPLIIRIWPGDTLKLLEWAKHNQIDDPNTAYLIPMLYSAVNAYPYTSFRWSPDPTRRRTRANSVCLIFSNNETPISLDPSEVSGYEYVTPEEAVKDKRITDDVEPVLRQALLEMVKSTLEMKRPEWHSTAEKIVATMLGEKVERNLRD